MSDRPLLQRFVRAAGWVVGAWVFVTCVVGGFVVVRWFFDASVVVSLAAGVALGAVNLVLIRFLPRGRGETVGESIAEEIFGG